MCRVAVLFFAIIGTSFAQEVYKGKCPTVRVVTPFVGSKFDGNWYEWGRFSSQSESETKCNVANYLFDSDGSVQISYSSIDAVGNTITMAGSAILPEPVGQFNVTIPELGTDVTAYQVLGTDYENWAALFACRDVGGKQHQRYVWFLTRNTCPTAASILAARDAIKAQGISTDPLEPVDQQNC